MKKYSKRPNLKDVATLAGASTATVSRALNNTGYVANDTRARVLQAARMLNYSPNLLARSLKQRSSKSIGLIIPNLLNAYYTKLADTICILLNQHGYQLLLASTRDNPENESDILFNMAGYLVDGIIWVPAYSNRELLEHLQVHHIPSVSIVRRIDGDPIDTVVFEDFAGSKAATEYLISLGHSRIGYIGGDIRYSSFRERRRGYMKAIQDAGLSPQSLVRPDNIRTTWSGIATNELLNSDPPPSAIFVASNEILPGVLQVLQHQSIKIPDDISLICFDDVDWFSLSTPPITAISVSPTRLSEEAVSILMSRIEDTDSRKKPPLIMEIGFEMILRSSTAAPRS